MGFTPRETAVALVADSTMTRPNRVSSSAVEAMSRNSVDTGVNRRPSETLAARPPDSERGGRDTCVIGAPPVDPVPHRLGEAMAPIRVTGELVEGCRRRGQQNRALAVDDPRRDLHDTIHDISSVVSIYVEH